MWPCSLLQLSQCAFSPGGPDWHAAVSMVWENRQEGEVGNWLTHCPNGRKIHPEWDVRASYQHKRVASLLRILPVLPWASFPVEGNFCQCTDSVLHIRTVECWLVNTPLFRLSKGRQWQNNSLMPQRPLWVSDIFGYPLQGENRQLRS